MSTVTWNATEAKEKMSKGTFAARAVRTSVYDNNNEIFAVDGYTTSEGVTYTFDEAEKQAMLDATIVYDKPFSVAEVPTLAEGITKKETQNIGCIEKAEMLIKNGYNPAVLNLADAYAACGGYHKGSNAQEESLCRQSTLSQSLYQYYKAQQAEAVSVPFRKAAYPMDMRNGGIYSPRVKVFRNGPITGYELIPQPWEMSVISVAALDFNAKHGKNRDLMTPNGGFKKEGEEILKEKIRTIYRIGLANGHDSLVLGAFGCGAFNLDPECVAFFFRQILTEDEFRNKYRLISFAILEGQGKGTGKNGKFAPFYRLFC